MDLKEEDILGDKIYDHWYYVAKGRAMRAFIGDLRVAEVVDVGAGSGIFSRQLLSEGLCERAVCVDPNYPVERTENHQGKQIRFVRSIDEGQRKLILMMDVLEHVSDDAALLQDYVSYVATGGYVFITVPAFQFMWSGHDVYLEHHRRYTIETLEAVVRGVGMTPVKSRYFFGSLFPVIAAMRVTRKFLLRHGAVRARSDLRLYPNWLNQTLITVHDIERKTFFRTNRLFGLSAFCLCRKTEGHLTISDRSADPS